jgi:hypothetical protein
VRSAVAKRPQIELADQATRHREDGRFRIQQRVRDLNRSHVLGLKQPEACFVEISHVLDLRGP